MLMRHCDDHFTTYTNIKSLCCAAETNISLCSITLQFFKKALSIRGKTNILHFINIKICLPKCTIRNTERYLSYTYLTKDINPEYLRNL